MCRLILLHADAIEIRAGIGRRDVRVAGRASLTEKVATAEAEHASGGVGLPVEFAPGERHEVTATADARLLLLLTP